MPVKRACTDWLRLGALILYVISAYVLASYVVNQFTTYQELAFTAASVLIPLSAVLIICFTKMHARSNRLYPIVWIILGLLSVMIVYVLFVYAILIDWIALFT